MEDPQASMEDPSQILSLVQTLLASCAELADELRPLLAKPLNQQIDECALPEEKIKTYHGYLYCLISVMFAHLKASGESTDNHPIMQELDRVKQSMARLKRTEQKESAPDNLSQLQQTLGTKPRSTAISLANFQGTHTKFNE